MCQLIFVKSKDPKIAATITYLQMYIDSITEHQDGYGAYANNSLFVSDGVASNITNLHRILTKMNATEYIGHVRKATSFRGKKDVKNSFSHPFDKEDFTLAHNGTLTWDKIVDETAFEATRPEVKSMIDSDVFATYLQSVYNGNMVTSVQLAMRKFNGKFAFIIFDKTVQKHFIVRGKATLYKALITAGEETILIINTEKESLKRGLVLTINILNTYGLKVEDFPKIEEIPAETISIIDGYDVKEVGKIKETTATYYHSTYKESTYIAPASSWQYAPPTGAKKLIDYCVDFIRDTGLSLAELDMVAKVVLNTPLFGMRKEDVEKLTLVLDELQKLNSQDKINAFLYGDCNLTNLQYPYMLNEVDELYGGQSADTIFI